MRLAARPRADVSPAVFRVCSLISFSSALHRYPTSGRVGSAINVLVEYALLGFGVIRLGHVPVCEEIYADYAGSRSSARREKKSEVGSFTPLSRGFRIHLVVSDYEL